MSSEKYLQLSGCNCPELNTVKIVEENGNPSKAISLPESVAEKLIIEACDKGITMRNFLQLSGRQIRIYGRERDAYGIRPLNLLYPVSLRERKMRSIPRNMRKRMRSVRTRSGSLPSTGI